MHACENLYPVLGYISFGKLLACMSYLQSALANQLTTGEPHLCLLLKRKLHLQ